MIRRLILAGLAVLAVQAQVPPPALTLCPTSMHPDTAPRILTVRGAGFSPATTATWQDRVSEALLAVEYVSATQIRITIPGTIGTVAGATGTLSVTTGAVVSTAPYTFNALFIQSVCDVEPAEFTAQRNPITFTVYGDQLYQGTTLSVGGTTVQMVPQPGVTVATATVPGNWTAGALTGSIGASSGNVLSSALFSLTVNPVPTITGSAASRMYAGQSASVNLTVAGGTPGPSGFRWGLGAGSPPWITIQTTGQRTASLAITPPADLTSAALTAQVTVTDGLQSQAVSSTPLASQVTVDALPDLALTALPADDKLLPDQQYTIRFGTNRATPLHLTGQINLGSATAAFISGTSALASVPFDIAANCVLPDPCSPAYTLQAGTVSGAVSITGTVTPAPPAGAAAPPPVVFPAKSLQQDPAPPQIDVNRVSVRQTTAGFDVCVPGFSNTRQMNNVSFRFVAAAGKSVSVSQSSRAVDSDFASWFTPQNTGAQGGFTLVQSFNLQGSIGAVGQVFVTLTNSAGASQEAGPIDLAGAPRCTVQ